MEHKESIYHLNKEKQSCSCEMVYLIGGGGGGGDGGMIHSSPEKSSAGKMGHRRGMYCCLGGLTGPPLVPDG